MSQNQPGEPVTTGGGNMAPNSQTTRTSEPERQDTAARPKGAGFFDAASRIGPLLLLLFLAAMVWPDFWQAMQGKALYCPAEAGYIKILRHGIAGGIDLTPQADGIACWPVFFWFGTGLARLSPHLPWLAYPLAAAVGAALALLGVWVYAMALGFGRRAAFAAGLLLLASPLIAPLGHFVGPSALAAALLVLSLAALCRGWQAERSWGCLLLGFILAGLAGLTGGMFHLFLPLIASFLFLLWRCAFRRAQSLDALAGFLSLLLMLGIWYFVCLVRPQAESYGSRLFASNTIQLADNLYAHWWLIPVIVLVGLMPWALACCFTSWRRIVSSAWTDLKASRTTRAGASFAWLSLAAGLLLSIFVPEKQAHAVAVCLACLAAPIIGKMLLLLPPLGCRLFTLLASILLLAAGGILLIVSFDFSLGWLLKFVPLTLADWQRAALLSIEALPLLGLLCLLAWVVALRFVKNRHIGSFLLYAAFVAVLLTQPVSLLLVPRLGQMPEMRLLQVDPQNAEPGTAAPQADGQAPAEVPTQPGIPPAVMPEVPDETMQPARPSETPAEMPDSERGATPAEPDTENPATTPEQPAPSDEQPGNQPATPNDGVEVL